MIHIEIHLTSQRTVTVRLDILPQPKSLEILDGRCYFFNRNWMVETLLDPNLYPTEVLTPSSWTCTTTLLYSLGFFPNWSSLCNLKSTSIKRMTTVMSTRRRSRERNERGFPFTTILFVFVPPQQSRYPKVGFVPVGKIEVWMSTNQRSGS